MNETVYRKAFKIQQFYSTQKIYIAKEKVKTFKETVSFHLASNHSNYLNQMQFTFSIFPAYQRGINIVHNSVPWTLRENPTPSIGQSQRALYTYLQALAI